MFYWFYLNKLYSTQVFQLYTTVPRNSTINHTRHKQRFKPAKAIKGKPAPRETTRGTKTKKLENCLLTTVVL